MDLMPLPCPYNLITCFNLFIEIGLFDIMMCFCLTSHKVTQKLSFKPNFFISFSLFLGGQFGVDLRGQFKLDLGGQLGVDFPIARARQKKGFTGIVTASITHSSIKTRAEISMYLMMIFGNLIEMGNFYSG